MDAESEKPTVEASKLFDLFQALGFEMAYRYLETKEVQW